MIAVTAVVLGLASSPVAGLAFAVAWANAAVILARLSAEGERAHSITWALAGLVLGPFAAAFLAWRYAGVRVQTTPPPDTY